MTKYVNVDITSDYKGNGNILLVFSGNDVFVAYNLKQA